MAFIRFCRDLGWFRKGAAALPRSSNLGYGIAPYGTSTYGD